MVRRVLDDPRERFRLRRQPQITHFRLWITASRIIPAATHRLILLNNAVKYGIRLGCE